jgi:hypothetical protein
MSAPLSKEFNMPQSLEDQIERLANFIMFDVPGEPSEDEGAVECAIRIIKERGAALAQINAIALKNGYSTPSARAMHQVAQGTLHTE